MNLYVCVGWVVNGGVFSLFFFRVEVVLVDGMFDIFKYCYICV